MINEWVTVEVLHQAKEGECTTTGPMEQAEMGLRHFNAALAAA
jgi:hypothetical protein